jgi:adenylate cyclase
MIDVSSTRPLVSIELSIESCMEIGSTVAYESVRSSSSYFLTLAKQRCDVDCVLGIDYLLSYPEASFIVHQSIEILCVTPGHTLTTNFGQQQNIIGIIKRCILMSINNNDNYLIQNQTIINLYESGIPPDVIASQLDINTVDVMDTLTNRKEDLKRKEKSVMDISLKPKMGMIYLDSVFNIESAIKDSQKRIWSELKVEPKFSIPLGSSKEILEKFVNTNIFLVILYVDLVSSTKISMNLPLKRLAPIIQTFTQEMSIIIDAYGGYVLKYVGDAVLAFFFTEKDDLCLPCSNAVNCGYSMVKIINEGINPILEENGYPELGIRVGIDVGENAVVQYEFRIKTYDIAEEQNRKENELNNDSYKKYNTHTLQEPNLDVLGYTINIATKMTSFAIPNQIIIGEAVYNKLDNKKQDQFNKIHIDNKSWDFLDNTTGNIYGLYGNLIQSPYIYE